MRQQPDHDLQMRTRAETNLANTSVHVPKLMAHIEDDDEPGWLTAQLMRLEPNEHRLEQVVAAMPPLPTDQL